MITLIIFISGIFLFISLIVALIARKEQGMWFWTKIYLARKGLKSTALIVDSSRKNTNFMEGRTVMYIYSVVLDVKDPALGDNYRVLRKYMGSGFSFLGDLNTEFPVIIHPKNKELVFVDYAEIKKQKKAEQKDKEEADEIRMAKLMDK
jgi:hypothetical protein